MNGGPLMLAIGPTISTRLLIIRNSSSGKSTLSERIGRLTSQPVFDLDLIHWHDDGRKRDEDLSRAMLDSIVVGPTWIIEGVYGWLAEEAVHRATALVWTDLPWAECREGLLHRGPRRGATAADEKALLSWAEAYWTRATPSSATGHGRLFEAFQGRKARLTSRAEVDAFLAGLRSEFQTEARSACDRA